MAPLAEEVTSQDANNNAAESDSHHAVFHKTDAQVDPGSTATEGNKHPNIFHPSLVFRKKDQPPPNPEVLGLEEELPGWHGYVEWEKYPERKQAVKKYLKEFDFPGVSLSQHEITFCILQSDVMRWVRVGVDFYV